MNRLALLIGSNPLPNLLAIRALNPERLLLFHSEQTKKPMDRLIHVIAAEGFPNDENHIMPVPIEDPSSMQKVQAKCADHLAADDHLNYTGGTKVMSSVARDVFRRKGGKDREASYVDDKHRCVVRDDGTEIRFDGIALSMGDVFKLHGVSDSPSTID